MPFQPTSPETEVVEVPVERTLDTFHIHEIHIFVDPNNSMATRAVVDWSEGFMDGETYVVGTHYRNEFSGTAFLQKMQEQVPAGDSYYTAVKRGFWDHMKEQGIVPAGDIT